MQKTRKEFANQYINPKIDIKDNRYKSEIIYHNENDEELFSYKKFVEVLKHTCEIRCYGEIYLVYNYKTGLSDELNVRGLSRLLKEILDCVDTRFWNSKTESKIIELIDRDFDEVKKIPVYEDYIFLDNGIYDIHTKKLEEYSPKIIAVKKINNVYNTNAKCPIFLQFINDCMCGDQDLIKCIQEIMGYVLIDNNKAQKFFLFYGIGSNGKSVLCDVIINMMGRDNISSLSIKQIKGNFTPSCIVGKKANISSENEADFETEKLKAITSGDIMTIDVKYAQPYDYRPTCKMIFATNNLPNTCDNSHGFYRRLIIIPFNRVFKEHEQDVNLIDKLIEEREGILMWSLEGLHRLIENNYKFTESEIVKSVIRSYKDSQDPVYMFFRENMNEERDNRIKRKEILERYVFWAAQNTIHTKGTDNSNKFWNELRRVSMMEGIHIQETKSKNDRFIKHLGWKA